MSAEERKQRHTEGEQQRRNREVIELLNELRVALPGVQVLFAFLLIVPFSQGFSSVSPQQRYVYFATLLCTGVSAALLIAPSSHRRLWRQHAREERLKAANRLSIGGLAFLALAMIGAIFLITDVLFGGVAAAVSAVGLGAVLVWYWYGQPLLRLRK